MAFIRCMHCPANTVSSPDAARMGGWRIWSGTTVTGVSKSDVVCPTCAGTVERSEPGSSWSVRCNTCDWQWEDEYGEGPLTAEDAQSLARDHECEPEVEVLPPHSTVKRAAEHVEGAVTL